MKYRKKPVIIDAVKYTRNFEEIKNFLGDNLVKIETERCINGKSLVYIKTIDSVVIAEDDDWICKGIQGEFYPCKPDIFKQTYEKVE